MWTTGFYIKPGPNVRRLTLRLTITHLKQEEEYEDHSGWGRVGRTRLPVAVEAVDEMVDSQKQTEIQIY